MCLKHSNRKFTRTLCCITWWHALKETINVCLTHARGRASSHAAATRGRSTPADSWSGRKHERCDGPGCMLPPEASIKDGIPWGRRRRANPETQLSASRPSVAHVNRRANTTEECVQLEANTHARTFLHVETFVVALHRITGNIAKGGQIAAPRTETYNSWRASDALKITRLPLSTGPFWGGPSTRAPHHISVPSSLGIPCPWYRGGSMVTAAGSPL